VDSSNQGSVQYLDWVYSSAECTRSKSKIKVLNSDSLSSPYCGKAKYKSSKQAMSDLIRSGTVLRSLQTSSVLHIETTLLCNREVARAYWNNVFDIRPLPENLPIHLRKWNPQSLWRHGAIQRAFWDCVLYVNIPLPDKIKKYFRVSHGRRIPYRYHKDAAGWLMKTALFSPHHVQSIFNRCTRREIQKYSGFLWTLARGKPSYKLSPLGQFICASEELD
jgi:hypothetical protein